MFNACMTVPLSDAVDVCVNGGAGSIKSAPEKSMVSVMSNKYDNKDIFHMENIGKYLFL